MSARCLIAILLGLLLVQHAGVPGASAQTPPPAAAKQDETAAPALPAKLAASLAATDATLTEVAKALRDVPDAKADFSSLRTKVETALDSATRIADKLRPRLGAIRSQIEKLGAAPKTDEPAETTEIAAERSRLTALVAAYDGAIKSGALTVERARQLINRITVLRHALFTRNLMQRRPSPLAPAAWREIGSGAASVGDGLSFWGEQWLNRAGAERAPLGLLLGWAVVVYVVLRLAIHEPTRRRRSQRQEPPLPTFFQCAVSAFRVAALRLLPVLAASVVLYVGLDALDLLRGNPWGRLISAVLKGVLVFAFIRVLVRAVLAPAAPQWRIVPLADGPALRLTWLLGAMAAIYALDGVLTVGAGVFSVPLSLSIVQSTALSLAFAGLLIGVLLTPFTPQDSADDLSPHRPYWLKLPLWALALGIVGAALLGYAALARFASQQVLLTGLVVLVGWLGYLAIRAFTREPTEQSRAVGAMLESRLGLDEPRRLQLAQLIEIALTFALALCALPFLMLQWGFSAADIRDWSASLLFGFEVGQFRISLVRILVGIVLFIALLLAIRVFQRWLRDTLLRPRMDAGLAHSIETMAGYALTALAGLIAVSYAGFDLTSLAIVAGALSLGIGFGLQSIFNNFVSGLILLIERPIKVGDRLIVGDQHGHVRRISVRATEFETFDRVSLIIPNSELISARVQNWTHRDQQAAFSIKIRVSYNSDPDEVIAILLKCAEDHPQVLPAPMAVLEGFGDSALLFNLRVTLANVGVSYGVTSDLRVAVFKALKAAGIEIPVNPIDVNLRDLEAMRRYLDEVLEQPPEGKAGKKRES